MRTYLSFIDPGDVTLPLKDFCAKLNNFWTADSDMWLSNTHIHTQNALLCFHDNHVRAKAPQCYVMRMLTILLILVQLQNYFLRLTTITNYTNSQKCFRLMHGVFTAKTHVCKFPNSNHICIQSAI